MRITQLVRFLRPLSPARVFDLFREAIAALIIVFGWAQIAVSQDISIEQVETETPPNIVFIFTDDLGYGDIGVFGADDVSTPNIDSLATNGAKFTQFYSASPVCSPSRAGLLTGRYPIRMGIHEAFFPSHYEGMPQSEITIAERLKSAGYVSSLIGKWHLGHHRDFLPLQQGFDEFVGIPYSNDMVPLPWINGNEIVEPTIDQSQLTKRLTEEATGFIDRRAGQPFFLLLAHPMPHVPLYASAEFEGVSERGGYGDVIEEIDWSVGEVLAALDRNKLTDNTLVVFSSDNGPWLVMGDDGGSNGDLRNGKGTTFEGGVRVPTMAQLPGTIAAGRVVDTPLSMLDWFPTFNHIAGVNNPEGVVLDGQDIMPILRETVDPDQDRVLAFYSHGKLEALRSGDWKFKREFDASTLGVPGPLRFILGEKFGFKSHGPLLFNLVDDPGEQKNVINRHPEKAEELSAALTAFEADMGDVPESITVINLGISPAIGVMMQSIFRFVTIALLTVLIVVAVIFFFLGRWLSVRKTKT